MKDSIKLFFLCFLCLLNLSLAILINDLFYVLSLLFGILIILFKFSYLESIILKNNNIPDDNNIKKKEINKTSADEHPIIVSARKRLNKKIS